jgi:DNA polymerase III subunit epsilon
MSLKWREATLVGFDVETSGKYPLEAEICEIAAVKWQGGKIIDTFQTLVATTRPMSKEVIAIHNITNEMLVGAPKISEAIVKFHTFIQGAYLVAHHAPFDLGFLAPEIERAKLPLPKNHVFCSSLLSRKAFKESENHKLQTLIKFFNLEQGQAHRALDDAKACLEVGMRVFAKIGQDVSIEDILEYQEAKLPWQSYALADLISHKVFSVLIEALRDRKQVQIVYSGGSRPGEPRTVHPLGLVRNPLDDYLVAAENLDEIPKRYFLNKIKAARL